MKNTLLISILIFFSFLSSKAQNTCNAYYPFNKGTVSEITHYNKKGKVETIEGYAVNKVSSDVDGNQIATISNTIKDKKGKKISDSEFEIICSGDKMELDIKSMISPDLYKQFKDFKVTVTGTDIEIPNNLAVGDELSDAQMNMNIDMSGMSMNMEIIMKDRKVEGFETITTKAGTFDCIVISYITSVKMGMSKEFKSKQWLSKGVGLVKSEEYSKKGKIKSSSELTAFSK